MVWFVVWSLAAAETPDNTLNRSACYEEFSSVTPSSVPFPTELLGLRCQIHCGCCQMGPCYWSSKGTPLVSYEGEMGTRFFRLIW